MIIRERHVLSGSGGGQTRLMVLWVGQSHIAVLDLLDRKSKPALMSTSAVEAALVAGSYDVETSPIEVTQTVGRTLNDRELKARDEFWALIEPLVQNVPAIYDRRQRGPLVAARSREAAVSVNTVKRQLDLYWRGGMRKAALVPNFAGRGPQGPLPAQPGAAKRGRKAGPTGDPHTDVTVEIQQAFQRAVDAQRKIAKNRFTVANAYKRFTDFECTVAFEDPETGAIIYARRPEYQDLPEPSYKQFKRWYDGTNQKERTGRILKGDALYEKDNRLTLGTAAEETWGPGSRYQIDATILEVALLSRHRHGDIIGKPVLYIVIDVWSRYIVGFYLGLTNASWAGAAMAIANCVEPKEDLLRRCGYDPETHPWEARHLSAALLADGGEIKSHRGDVLVSDFNCTVETAAPHRADWKGIVEQRFNITNVRIGPYVPGHVDISYRGRGAEDYRFSARLTLDDLTEIIVGLILEYNNHHELKGLDLDPDVDAAGIPKIPLHLWRFGSVTRGDARSYDPNALRFAMMKSDWVSLTTSGIEYRGRFYSCPELLASELMSKVRDGRTKVMISWDDRIVGQVYWHNKASPTGYYVCRLTTKSRSASEKDRSFWELDDADDRRKAEARDRKHGSLGDRAALSHRIDSIVERAEAAFKDGPQRDDRDRVKGIHDHRRAERESDAPSEAPPLRDPAPRATPHLTLVADQPDDDDDDDFEIGVTELRGKDDD